MTDNLHDAIGELRSLLAQPPDARGFAALIERADALATADPARFEAEALPYLAQHLDRWYDACAPGALYLAGATAERALLGGAPWLSLVRDLNLAEVSAAQPVIDALLGSRRLTRLEALTLPDSLPERVVERVLRAPLAAQLHTLELDRHRGGSFAVLRKRPLPKLTALRINIGALDTASARAIGASLPALRSLDLLLTSFSGRGLIALLEQLTSSQLERLVLGDVQTAGPPVWQALAALLAARPDLELDSELLSWSPEALAAIIAAPALPLRDLSVDTADGPVALDALIMSPIGQGLRTLTLDHATLDGAEDPLSSDHLAVLKLDLRAPHVSRALATGRWPALRDLRLRLLDAPDLPRVLAPLRAAQLPALVDLTIHADNMSAATLRDLLSSPLLSRIGSLDLRLTQPLDDEQLDAILQGAAQLPDLSSLDINRGQLPPAQQARVAQAASDRLARWIDGGEPA